MSPVAPADRRDQAIDFRGSGFPGLRAEADHAAARAGVSTSTWIRDILLNAAGWHDTTRRTARRRPNQQPRTATPGRLYASVSPREKAIIQRAASRDGLDVSAWATTAIQEALDQEGQRR
jgi:predicted HicB family RNase H-like nuclease